MPQPVVRLTPVGENIAWIAGRGVVVAKAADGVRPAAAFDHQDGETAAFRVEIENDSAARMDVDPKDMQFTTCVTAPHCRPRARVIDPERILLALDQERASETASATNAAVAGTALLLLRVTGDVAGAASGHDRNAGQATAAAADGLEGTMGASQQRLADLDAQRLTWSSSTLRRTTLLPGQGVAGWVFVPLVLEDREVWLDVWVNGHDFWFRFQQTIYKPPVGTRADHAMPVTIPRS
jgi:hypothetical protein